MKKFILLITLFSLSFFNGKAQNIALKSNLLWDATATLNAGVEIGLSPKWTLDISGNYNALTFPEFSRIRQLSAQPEVRYWFCERFGGHFLGIHAHGGIYNLAHLENNLNFLGTDFSKLSNDRYQGWFVGAGIGYGYAWILGKHWNLEAEAGFGYSYTRSDHYPCATCGTKIEENLLHHYVGLTKLALSVIYLF